MIGPSAAAFGPESLWFLSYNMSKNGIDYAATTKQGTCLCLLGET